MFIKLPIGQREVFLTVFVSRLFDAAYKVGNTTKKKTVATCRFTTIKEEDRRFLFERLYKARYS